MKQFVFVLFFVAFAGSIATVKAQRFTLGMKGGASIPNLTSAGDDNPLTEGYKSRLAGDAGIYGEYHFSKHFSLSVGLEYSGQGGQKNNLQAFYASELVNHLPSGYSQYEAVISELLSSTSYLYADFKSVAKLNYVLVPVLARFTRTIGGRRSKISVYGAIGPFMGILLTAKQETSGSSKIYMDAAGSKEFSIYDLTLDPVSFDGTTNIRGQLQTFNVGIDGFGGFSYKMTRRKSLFIEAGGNFGFIPVQKGDEFGKNRIGAGTIMVGYAYTLR
jgi:hypothetical protein